MSPFYPTPFLTPEPRPPLPSTTATASYYTMPSTTAPTAFLTPPPQPPSAIPMGISTPMPMDRYPTPPPFSPVVGNRLSMLEQGGYFEGTDAERDNVIASLMAMYRPQTYLPPAYAQNMGGMPSAPNYYFPPEIPRGSPGGPISGPPPRPAPIPYPPSVNPAAFRSGKIAMPEPEPEE
jgi:hypothetical protein